MPHLFKKHALTACFLPGGAQGCLKAALHWWRTGPLFAPSRAAFV
jgi:hypothetical protein